jgi:hypothetical protein
MFIKKPQHRVFDYEPRYYNPSDDKDEKLKRRLGFSRRQKSIGKKGGVIKALIVVILILIAYIYLTSIN